MTNTKTESAKLADWLERYNRWRRDDKGAQPRPPGNSAAKIRFAAAHVGGKDQSVADALTKAADYLQGLHSNGPHEKDFGRWIDIAVETLRAEIDPKGN
jgi:hypothetical protein